MILPIGNKPRGFTFVEVMVALVVLATGIVFIYKSFFLCVDYLSRLTARMYANEIIDEKMAEVSRIFHETADLTAVSGTSMVQEKINQRTIKFNCHVGFEPVIGNDSAFKVKVVLSWTDGGRTMKTARLGLVAL